MEIAQFILKAFTLDSANNRLSDMQTSRRRGARVTRSVCWDAYFPRHSTSSTVIVALHKYGNIISHSLKHP